jgi:hypothetical protein
MTRPTFLRRTEYRRSLLTRLMHLLTRRPRVSVRPPLNAKILAANRGARPVRSYWDRAEDFTNLNVGD